MRIESPNVSLYFVTGATVDLSLAVYEIVANRIKRQKFNLERKAKVK